MFAQLFMRLSLECWIHCFLSLLSNLCDYAGLIDSFVSWSINCLIIRRASASGVSDHTPRALDIACFNKSAKQTCSNSIFEHKTRARAAIVGPCARIVASCREVRTRGGLSKALKKGQYMGTFTWTYTFVDLCFCNDP